MRALLFLFLPAFIWASEIVFIENFESNTHNWTVQNGVQSDITWIKMSELPLSAISSGTFSAISKNKTALFDTSLISPTIDLRTLNNATLSFELNYQNFAGQDRFEVYVSYGKSWQLLRSFDSDYVGKVELSLQTGAEIALKFRYYDLEYGNDMYVSLDNVKVVTKDSFAVPLSQKGYVTLMLLIFAISLLSLRRRIDE